MNRRIYRATVFVCLAACACSSSGGGKESAQGGGVTTAGGSQASSSMAVGGRSAVGGFQASSGQAGAANSSTSSSGGGAAGAGGIPSPGESVSVSSPGGSSTGPVAGVGGTAETTGSVTAGGRTGGSGANGGTSGSASGGSQAGAVGIAGSSGGGTVSSGGSSKASTLTTGGASAAGGTAGVGNTTTGGATGSSSLVVPTNSGSKYRFSFGDVVLEIDAAIGARVSTLTLGGTVCVQPPATDLTTWGSTFWTSPRSDWTPSTWPPPTAIDSGPFTASISGTHALFTGTEDTSMGVSINKDYSVDGATGWITINYTINSRKAIKAAPWEVTRVPRGGLVFFPTGTTALTKGPWTTVTQSSGITWIDDASRTTTSANGTKAYGDGSGGWVAYAQSGVLFLKKFSDTPANAQAPSDGEIGIYPGTGFLEYEVQGPYTSIAVGGKLDWSVKWRLVKIPTSVTVGAGSSSLSDFAAQQAAH